MIKKANTDVREAITAAGFKYWQVADILGVNDGNFSRMLRTELSADKKQKIYEAIQILREENCNE